MSEAPSPGSGEKDVEDASAFTRFRREKAKRRFILNWFRRENAGKRSLARSQDSTSESHNDR
jgi:hypothetical protein